jgi:hypothetical protein
MYCYLISCHLQHAQLANKACIVILLAVTYSIHLLFFCFVNFFSAKNECLYNPVDLF